MVDNNQKLVIDKDTNFSNISISNDWPTLGGGSDRNPWTAELDPNTGKTIYKDYLGNVLTVNGEAYSGPVNVFTTLTIREGATVDGSQFFASYNNPTINIENGGVLQNSNVFNGYVYIKNGGVSQGNSYVSEDVFVQGRGKSIDDAFYDPQGVPRASFTNPNAPNVNDFLPSDGESYLSVANGGVVENGSSPDIKANNPNARPMQTMISPGASYNLPADYSSEIYNNLNIQNDYPVISNGAWTARLDPNTGKTVYTNGSQTLEGPVNMTGGSLTVANGAVVDGLYALPGVNVTVQNGGTLQNSNIYSGNVAIQAGGKSTDNTYISSTVSIGGNSISDGDRFYNITRTTSNGSTLINPNLSGGSLSFTTSNRQGSINDSNAQSKITNPTIDNQSGGNYTIYVNGNGNTFPCFLVGTVIQTARGNIVIEDLKVDDEVYIITPEGQKLQHITSIIKNNYYVKFSPFDDVSGYPVCITKGAIAENVPFEDLFVTPDHCLFFEDMFIPVRMLVNDHSIFYDYSQKQYTYYHIETGEHSVIIANGMLTESFLNTSNHTVHRSNVINFPKTWEKDAAAPLSVDRENVEPIYNMLLKRALEYKGEGKVLQKNITKDHETYLITDNGNMITGLINGTKAVFVIPQYTKNVRIVSRSNRPCDVIGPFVDDRRCLGILIKNISIVNNDRLQQIDTHLSENDLSGWHGLESKLFRWTNGSAHLPLNDYYHHKKYILAIEIISAGPYLLEERKDYMQKAI